MIPDLRAFVLARGHTRVADLMRQGLTYHQACRALEDLESDRLVGHRSIHGISEWSPGYPVDEERVKALRELYGKAPRLVPCSSFSTSSEGGKRARLPRAALRRHISERHPGTASRCARCRR
jgi:hypothetical protein